ncbi:heme-binding protein [Allopusillimonas soli]|uniref:Heme-binding protein n=1 Tax=Allopusillimonas soli TaxID=659016 RepID=A0A853F9I3_9BURK|nr:heme-binding protein [Allopusillimonas soli]NYT36262.1 heme-binding protein [Allopusillimonas soli]TEA76586.1 heme-binding protein [Allopusillimonas soli]
MITITLEQAHKLADVAMKHGQTLQLAPLTIAVLDAGGCIVLIHRADGSSLLRPQIAIAKAWGVLGMGFGGRELARRARANPPFFNAVSDMANGNIVPTPGGVLIRAMTGAVMGSIGISGDTSENDEVCAVRGIESLSLIADTGE